MKEDKNANRCTKIFTLQIFQLFQVSLILLAWSRVEDGGGGCTVSEGAPLFF